TSAVDGSPFTPGAANADAVKTTSSAVNGRPSCQSTSRRRLNVNVVASGDTTQLSARSGSGSPLGPRRVRPENIRSERSASGPELAAKSGLIRTGGGPITPSTYRPPAAGSVPLGELDA